MKSSVESILNLSQAIKATPFSEEGRDCLENLGLNKKFNEEQLKNHFINNVYVEPFYSEESKDAEVTDEEEYKEEYDEELAQLFNREDEIIDDNIRQKLRFEKELDNKIRNIFMITATAGSGKTTYLNRLFIEKQEKNRVLILDIENTNEIQRNVRILDNPLELGTIYDLFVGRVISALLYQINQCIRRETQETIEIYKKRMKSFADCYTKVFIESNNSPNSARIDIPKIYNIFKTLLKFAEDDSLNLEKLSLDLIEHFKKIIILDNDNSHKQIIINLFNILFRLLYCKQESDHSIPKFCFIAVDNIERIIGADTGEPVLTGEHEVILIIRAITESVEDTAKFISSFREYFIVLLSMRNISSAKYRTDQEADRPAPLDISRWFDAEKIYSNKVKIYYPNEDKEQLKNNYIYKAFKTILDDKYRKAGLYRVLLKMYNFNKRRIPIVLLEHILNLKNNAPIVKQYLEMWERSTDELKKQNTEKDRTLIWSYRYLCRKSIMRLLYNHYDHKKLWESLKVGNSEGVGDFASYTRRILTFLSARHFNDRSDNNTNYSYLSDLVNNVIKPVSVPYIKKIDYKNFEQLAEILYRMSDIHMVPFDWSPLVELIINNNQKFNPDTIRDALMESQKNQNYRITITDAGEIYALFNVDFEYFAVRYYPGNREPLFAEVNLKKKIDGEKESYECLKIIRIVREETEKCIKELIKYDKNYFFQINNSHPYEKMYNGDYLIRDNPHPVRLVRNHVGYLDAFKKYISYLDNNVITNEDKEIIKEQVSNEICLYTKMLNSFIDEDKNGYFKKEHKMNET
jgi:hypothetical protein